MSEYLTALMSEFDGLIASLDAVRAEMNAIGNRADVVRANVTSIKQGMRTDPNLEENLDDWNQRLSDEADEITELNARYGELQARSSQLSAAINRMRAELSAAVMRKRAPMSGGAQLIYR